MTDHVQPWLVGTEPLGTGQPPTGLPRARDRSGDSIHAGDARMMFLGAVRVADIVVILIASLLAYRIREGTYDLEYQYWLLIVIGCFVAASALGRAGVYSLTSLRDKASQLGRATAAWAVAVLAVVASIYFTKSGNEYSRAWVLIWAATGCLGLVGVRTVAWAGLSALRKRGRLALNVAVIGEGDSAAALARRLEKTAQDEVRIVGVFRPKADRHVGSRSGDAAAEIDDLIQLARRVRIDEIAVSFPCPDGSDLGAALRKLCVVPVDVMLCPEIADLQAIGVKGVRVPSAQLWRRPLAGWRSVVKRTMDIVLSATGLVLLAPLMLTIAVLVKLDSPGHVLFRQRRFGFSKEPITVHKFRTMYQEAALDASVPQARRGDPRVTRVGRFLRRTSLDELPQLCDVLVGRMSLVGPRPHAIAHDEKYAALVDGYLGRLRVRPGITGWAQVNGWRGETDTIEKMQQRVAHDLYYIDHWTPLFDLYILLMTVFVGFSHRNAY